MDKKGGVLKFSAKIFFVTVPKKFVREPFSLSLISGVERLFASDGYVTIFHRKLFVSQGRKTS